MKVIFTDRFIQTAKIPLTGRVEHYDQRAKGLCLRITPNGKRTFSFIYREEGDKTQQRKTLGEYPYLNLADARKSAIAMQNRLNQGLAVFEKKQVTTFEEVANLYWEKELKHIKTCDEEWRRLTKDAIPAWRKKAISAITVQDVSKLLSNVRERIQSTQQPRSNNASQHGIPAANRLQTRLSRLFRFACEQGLCEDVPTERIVRKKEGSRDRVLTAKEIKQFWQLCTQSLIDEKTKTALKLILLLGPRPGEICCMRWEDINWEQATWLNVTSKTGEKNTVPLSPAAIALLEPLRVTNKLVKQTTGYVFKSNNVAGHVKRNSLTQALRRCCIKIAGLDKFTPHDLRRTMRSMLAELGVKRDIAERILSHRVKGVEGVYDRYDYLVEKREALALWDIVLQKILESDTDDLAGNGWLKILQFTKNQQFIMKAQNVLRQINQHDSMQIDLNSNPEILFNIIAALST